MRTLIFALLWSAHFLPYRALVVIGNIVGVLAFWLIAECRHVTRVNLAKCFPQMKAQEREALARAHFRAFCRSFVDRALLWWAPRARVERLVRIEGLEHPHALGGAPVILFAPHFVGMDAGGTRMTCEVNLDGDGNPDGTLTLRMTFDCGATNTGEDTVVINEDDFEDLDVTFSIDLTDPDDPAACCEGNIQVRVMR